MKREHGVKRERKYTAAEVEEILEEAAQTFEIGSDRDASACDEACQRLANQYHYVASKFAGWAECWSGNRRAAV